MYNPYILGKNICKTLFEQGYTAYFAGGWVRDFLLNRPTDEIDIATSAPPHIIQKFFPKTIPVGIAFGVVIVVVEGINFEVATFRKDHPYMDGRHPDGVDFSTPEKDAQRRDFTINGMFYDPLTEIIYDFVEGKKDLERGIIRAIGEPGLRFEEDRLRMVRAVRFSARFQFPIETNTAAAIKAYAQTLLPAVSMERIWQELSKMTAYPHFDAAILMLNDLGLLRVIFPKLEQISKADLEKRGASFPYFPTGTPTMAYLLELFPNQSLEEKLELALYLKTPLHDRAIVEFFHKSHELMDKKTVESVEWAHFYAHPLSPLFLNVAAAKILPPAKLSFLEEHRLRQEKLKEAIRRIRERTPLVYAAHLIQKGIQPGKKMGELLKEAERIAINGEHTKPESVLNELKLD